MMKHLYSKFILSTLICSTVSTARLSAGNEDRVGQAGASELLINPFARSSGWAGANTSHVRGLEAMYLNVAGTAFTKKTELIFSHSMWLGKAAGVNINSFGFTQAVGKDKTGTLGMSVMSMNFGDIMRTTVDAPEGGLGFFTPSFTNIGISYAKEFSNSIYGGIVFRTISQSISDINALGVCFDAGIQYVTGANENLRFGISIRNIGPKMRYNGDGLSFKGTVPETGANLTVQHRSEAFEMPSLLNIGVSYTFDLTEQHQIIAAGNFMSNSFSKDNFQFGLEYEFKKMFMVRGGYNYEPASQNLVERSTALTGPTAGFTFEAPISKGGTTFALDYSYRAANPFSGVHTFGARINL
jgi:hypothetical protein